MEKPTIGLFRGPSSTSSDSSTFVYFPAEDSSLVIVGNQPPEKSPLLNMESERITALEQALSELQARDEATQQKLDILISHISKPSVSTPNPVTQTITPETHSAIPSTRGLRPALPTEFDGDRSKGMAFLYSCQTYICLCSASFPDDQTKITWALSYMKTGRAALWAAW